MLPKLLSTRNICPKAHKGVISKFGLEFVKKGFVEDVYGRALSHAKDRREMADYDIKKNLKKEEAEQIIKDAKNFLKRIKKAVKEINN